MKQGERMSIDRKDLDKAARVYAVVCQQPVRVYVDSIHTPPTKYAFLPIYSSRDVPKGLHYYYDVGLEEAEKGLCQQPIKN